jgi:hypothetical protein
MKYKFTLILILSFLFACSTTKDSQATQKKPTSNPLTGKPYIELVNKAIEDPENAPYYEIRISYSESAFYSPYKNPEDIEEMRKLFNANKNEEVVQITKKSIQKYFAELDFHYFSMAAYKKLNNENAYKWHKYVLYRLLDSIFDSGDGKSTKTAFTVITVREEYAFMGLVGIEHGSQHLINEDGHSYDMFEVKKSESYKANKVYFNIDISMASLSKIFKR